MSLVKRRTGNMLGVLALFSILVGCNQGDLGSAQAPKTLVGPRVPGSQAAIAVPTVLPTSLAQTPLPSAVPTLLTGGIPARTTLPKLSVFLFVNLKTDADLSLALGVIDRAAAAGYTGVLLDDYWLQKAKVDTFPFYLSRLALVLDRAASKSPPLSVDVVALPFGHSNPILDDNPGLAEGQPVKATSFTVGADGTLVPDNTITGLSDGGFEAATTPTEWSTVNAVTIDGAIAHRGTHSARFEAARSTLRRTFAVQPFHQYHVGFWTSTSGFSGTVNVQLQDSTTHRARNFNDFTPPATQGWTAHDFVADSMDSTSLDLVLTRWLPNGGQLWIDDVVIEDKPLVNLVRGAGAPLRIYGPTGVTYREGTDISPVIDATVATAGSYDQPTSHPYDAYHAPPTLRALGGALPAGTQVLLDYYAIAPIGPGLQSGACLSDPGTEAYVTANLKALDKVLPPNVGIMLGYDEIRHANTCAICSRRGLTAGQLIADSIQRTSAAVRALRPNAWLGIWNDMVDPYHNAIAGDYYLVEHDLTGSWDGIPAGATIMNWNIHDDSRLSESLAFFAGKGFGQLINGYFDSGDGTGSGSREAIASHGVPAVQGCLYTTWHQDYSQLENYAAAVKANW